MGANSIVLYGAGTISPMVRKVEYALRLKRIAYEPPPLAEDVDRFSINPLGQVPAVRHGALQIGGSSIICRYLDDVEPTPRLQPVEAFDEARCRWLTAIADGPMWDIVRSIWLGLVVRPLEGVDVSDETRAEVARSLDELAPFLVEIDRQLGGRSGYIIDAELRLADMALAALFSSLELAGHPISSIAAPNQVVLYASRLDKVGEIRALFDETASLIEAF